MPPQFSTAPPQPQQDVSPVKDRQPPTEAVAPPLERSWRTAVIATPIVSSAKVSEYRPEISGVNSSSRRSVRDWSAMPLTANVKFRPGASRGRVVRMLIVEPMPPVGTSARPLL